MLDALRGRYEMDLIYTYAQNILIAVNPHKGVPHLYGMTMMEQYHGSMLGEITPHAYAVAEEVRPLFSVLSWWGITMLWITMWCI